MMSEIAVPLRVMDVLAEFGDAPVKRPGGFPLDFRGAFTVHPVLVEPFRAGRVRDQTGGTPSVYFLYPRVMPDGEMRYFAFPCRRVRMVTVRQPFPVKYVNGAGVPSLLGYNLVEFVLRLVASLDLVSLLNGHVRFQIGHQTTNVRRLHEFGI
jgi:hypothetical protein